MCVCIVYVFRTRYSRRNTRHTRASVASELTARTRKTRLGERKIKIELPATSTAGCCYVTVPSPEAERCALIHKRREIAYTLISMCAYCHTIHTPCLLCFFATIKRIQYTICARLYLIPVNWNPVALFTGLQHTYICCDYSGKPCVR